MLRRSDVQGKTKKAYTPQPRVGLWQCPRCRPGPLEKDRSATRMLKSCFDTRRELVEHQKRCK
jgi:hypothetical protein